MTTPTISGNRSLGLQQQRPFLTDPCILISVYLNCAGWVLSAMHQLNAAGYAVALSLGLLALWRMKPEFGRIRMRRFRRMFPLCFLILVALEILGGALHAPNNYDGLSYRIPRIMHWLSAESWHWIHTDFPRLNTRATGWEWLAAPVIALTGGYRWVFGINAVLFLTLPGLVFSVFTRLGVKPRVAWFWMWVAPAGYCFLLQAGSIANDMIGAVYALAAMDYALRAKVSGRVSEVWLSGLSAALMTASKSSLLPLLLPWLLCVWPALPLLWKRPAATLAVILCGIGASLLPISVLNYRQCGDWTGQAVEGAMMEPSPLHLPTNLVLMFTQNLVPPVFPMANAWNAMVKRVVPPDLTRALEKCSEPTAAHFTLVEINMEEAAGLGFGASLLVVLSAAAALLRRAPERGGGARLNGFAVCLLLAPVCAALLVMHKSGLFTLARMLTPFYPLMLPALLVTRAQARLVRTRWWRGVALGSLLIAFVPLIVSPARPLWPVQTFLAWLDAEHSPNPLLKRVYAVYTVYGGRANGFAPAIAALPTGLRVLGLVTGDDPESSLWLPLGARRIEHVTSADTPDDLRARGIEYLLVRPSKVNEGFEAWRAKMGLQPVRTIPLALRASQGKVDWHLLRVPAAR